MHASFVLIIELWYENGSNTFPYPVDFLSPPKLISICVKYLESIMSAWHDEITLELIDNTFRKHIFSSSCWSILNLNFSCANFPLLRLLCARFLHYHSLSWKGVVEKKNMMCVSNVGGTNTNRTRWSKGMSRWKERTACNKSGKKSKASFRASWPRETQGDGATCTCSVGWRRCACKHR